MKEINPIDIQKKLQTQRFSFTHNGQEKFCEFEEVLIKDKKIVCIFKVEHKEDARLALPTLEKSCKKILDDILEGVELQILCTLQTSSGQSAGQPSSGTSKAKPSAFNPQRIDGVKKIIAVAAGKGGVGKSTIAFNLALTLSEQGHKVGLLDADIHGPSLALLSGINDPCDSDKNGIIPHEKWGVKMMSMAFLTQGDGAVIWRGSMVTKALLQMFFKTNWQFKSSGLLKKFKEGSKQDLDILIIDYPPGTSDIHISIAQNVKVDGAVLISTPQAMSLIDVKKAKSMFEKTHVPILGGITNMAYLSQEENIKIPVFGEDNFKPYCAEHSIDFLGQLPLSPELAQASDKASPLPDTPSHIKDIFNNIAQNIYNIIEK